MKAVKVWRAAKKEMSNADICTGSVFVWQRMTNLWHAESSDSVLCRVDEGLLCRLCKLFTGIM
jgi:hypothetical protein